MVVGPVSSWFDTKRRCARERFFLQLHVGMQINLSCLDGLVPKPESNNRTVDAILEKVHGGGMSQHMRTYILPPKRWALFCGDGDVFLHQALNCITAELSASNAGKERIVRTAMALPYPGFQYFCRFGT